LEESSRVVRRVQQLLMEHQLQIIILLQQLVQVRQIQQVIQQQIRHLQVPLAQQQQEKIKETLATNKEELSIPFSLRTVSMTVFRIRAEVAGIIAL
jgi:hypothetical protein